MLREGVYQSKWKENNHSAFTEGMVRWDLSLFKRKKLFKQGVRMSLSEKKKKLVIAKEEFRRLNPGTLNTQISVTTKFIWVVTGILVLYVLVGNL